MRPPLYIVLLIAVALWTPRHLSAETVASTAEDLLQGLEGEWAGRAVITPRGPLPYDLHFRSTEDGAVYGVADPGAAEHHWRFSRDGGALVLRFLTTFAGNTEPIFLDEVLSDANGVLFRGRAPDYLTVRVTPGNQETWIRVSLRGEQHVVIRLRREN